MRPKYCNICLNLAGIHVQFSLYSEHTREYFTRYMPSEESFIPSAAVSSDEIRWSGLSEKGLRSSPFDEYTYIMVPVSDLLLRFGRCVFHGVSLIWQNTAYILTGPSGVGKTTFFRRWKEQFPDEISIMNGDKPILEWRSDDSFMVHPSPWRGKEGFGSMITAKLGGIILLEQSSKNEIRRMEKEEAVLPIYGQLFKTENTKENINDCIHLEEALLKCVPVWKLLNRADREAILLARGVLIKQRQSFQNSEITILQNRQ